MTKEAEAGSGTAVALTCMLNPLAGAASLQVDPESLLVQSRKVGVGEIEDVGVADPGYFQPIVPVPDITTAYWVLAAKE